MAHRFRDAGYDSRYKTCGLFGMAARDESGVVRWSGTTADTQDFRFSEVARMKCNGIRDKSCVAPPGFGCAESGVRTLMHEAVIPLLKKQGLFSPIYRPGHAIQAACSIDCLFNFKITFPSKIQT
jgi:hypothetical protein